MTDDLVKRLRDVGKNYELARGVHVDIRQAADRIEELEAKLEALDHAYDSIVQAFRFEALRTDDAESKLAKAVEIIAAAKEMYETAMLTGGGSPEAWVNHVRARNAFASTLAELSSVSCANSKGQGDE